MIPKDLNNFNRFIKSCVINIYIIPSDLHSHYIISYAGRTIILLLFFFLKKTRQFLLVKIDVLIINYQLLIYYYIYFIRSYSVCHGPKSNLSCSYLFFRPKNYQSLPMVGFTNRIVETFHVVRAGIS